MKELESRFVLQEAARRTIGERDTVLLRAVLASRIPDGIKALVRAEVSDTLLTEFESSRKLERVFRRGEPKERLMVPLSRAFAYEYQCERREFLPALERAVTFLARYLCRPRQMLEQWVFGFRTEMEAEDVRRKLGAIADYRYLSVLLNALIREKNLARIDRTWFRKSLGDLDGHVAALHSRPELARLAKPIFDFVEFGQEDASVPLDLIRSFYLEKGLEDFWNSVERSARSGQESISRDEFLGMMADPETKARRTEPPAAQPAETVPEQVTKGEEADVGPELGENEPLPVDEKHEEQEDRSTSVGFPSLSSVISEEQRNAFVSGLFRKDRAYYEAVIAALDGLPTWKDAALYLSEFYQTNNLDPFSDHVIEFTDVVHHRYGQMAAG